MKMKRDKKKNLITFAMMISLLITIMSPAFFTNEEREQDLFKFGGDGGMKPKTSYYEWYQTTMNVHSYVTGFHVADANNDGYNDLVLANGNNKTASILIWNESMLSWNEEIIKEFGETVDAIIIEDADNDGYNDLIARNSDNLTILLWNDISKDWIDKIQFQIEIYIVYNYIDNFAVEDANNDGYNDIVVNDEYESEIFFWNNTIDDWNDPIFDDGLGISLNIKDANNDGFNDLIAYHPWNGNPGRNRVIIRLWNSSIGYWDPEFNITVAEDDISSLFVEDVNNDGYNDIITTNYEHSFPSENKISIRLWNEHTQYWDPLFTKPIEEASSISSGDVNNDGYSDIILYGEAYINYHWEDVIFILIWDDEIKNWKTPVNKIIDNPEVRPGPIVTDVDNDGDYDIAFLSSGNDEITFILWEFFDVYSPIVNIHDPLDGDVFYYGPPSFFVEVSDSNSSIDSMWYSLNGGITNYTFYDNGTISLEAWEAVLDGTVKITFYANDTEGNIGFNEVTVYKDMHLPSLQFNSPYWNITYSNFLPIDFSFNDDTLDEIRIIMDNSPEVNYSVYPYLDYANILGRWQNLDDGQISIEFHAKDILGKDNIYVFVVNKDTTAPVITINSPKQYDKFWEDSPHFDISIEEPNLDSVWYEIEIFYYKSANFSITELTGSVDKGFWDSLGDNYLGSSCRITFYANDTLGHLSSKSVVINREVPGPSLSELIILSSIIGGVVVISIVIYFSIKQRLKKRKT